MEKICVAVRLRPVVSEENTITGSFWKVEDNHRISLHRSDGTPFPSLSYAFDHVFDDNCTNGRVYELLTKDVIHAAVAGFNGTVFAYGQTSSGKTFTMNGSEADPGVIHRAVKDIFDLIEMVTDREFLIRVSYMEIYNEEINDLFVVENQKLQIHESLERGIYVAGLREEIVSNAEQVLKLIESGEANRHFGETNMNARSSRSHTIFRMVIESKGKVTDNSNDHAGNDAIRVSVLNLVDLAGSERIAKTGADGVRLKEGKHINKSLMVLGNVINKLSDGTKQRAHIPYRDSKLTRILQSALGGNAKTSIICTIAPEEIHVEETKGTLQFASRAKRVTNCAQVNEILTEAALLKRQKLEIEELRGKLQGSHAEVLEQEILKLRNDMLKYELERDRLELELELERKSHKERDERIREQQLKIDSLSSLVALSDCDRNSSQGLYSGRKSNDEFSEGNSICRGDTFVTPHFRAAPDSFVVRRSNYSKQPDYSPLPETTDNVADEDAWLEMNKGYTVDLDSIQMTPAREAQSFPTGDASSGFSSENYEQDVQSLKRQLELVTKEKIELEEKQAKQILVNDKLLKEIEELKSEVLVKQEIPQKLLESVASCKDIYKDVLLSSQKLMPDEENRSAKLLSSVSEIGVSLFSKLEEYVSMIKDSHESLPLNEFLVEEHKLLSERLGSVVTAFVPSGTSTIHDKEAINLSRGSGNKGCTTGEDTELERVLKEKYNGLMEELDFNNQLLEASRERCNSLERDYQVIKEERDSLAVKTDETSKDLERIVSQKENIVRDFNVEAQRRKGLEDEIKQLSVAFGDRHRLIMSLHNEVRSKIESFKAKPTSISNVDGCGR